MIVVTSGMLKTIEECPQKYNLIYNEHVETPSDSAFSDVGKEIHALINYKFKGFDITKQLSILSRAENKLLRDLWQNFSDLNINNVERSEFTFNVPFDENFVLTGRVDAIRKNNQDVEILDWKTGRSDNINPENDMQTIVYLYCIYKLFACQGIVAGYDNLSLTYYFLKEKKSATIKFSEKKLHEYEQILKKSLMKISEISKSYPINKKQCPSCSFKIVCDKAYKLS